MDIFVTFLSPYERFDGTFEGNIKKISTHYIKSQLLIDVVACFPTWVLELGASFQMLNYRQEKQIKKLNSILDILRVFKGLKLFKFMKTIQTIITSKLTGTEARTLLTLLASFFMVHVFACLFYLEARLCDFTDDTWVTQKGILDNKTLDKWYMSMYWAF